MAAPDTQRDLPIRPELTQLTDVQRQRVQSELERRRATCPSCGLREFLVGDALYAGFLFVNEDIGTYVIALTCTNDDCPDPRTGLRLDKSLFLAD